MADLPSQLDRTRSNLIALLPERSNIEHWERLASSKNSAKHAELFGDDAGDNGGAVRAVILVQFSVDLRHDCALHPLSQEDCLRTVILYLCVYLSKTAT